MSQHDYSLLTPGVTGNSFRDDLEAMVKAAASCNSGPLEPSPTFPNMLWADTTTNELKQRNLVNSAWITIGNLGVANLNLVTPTALNAATNLLVTKASRRKHFFYGGHAVGTAGSTQTIPTSAWSNLSTYIVPIDDPESLFNTTTKKYTCPTAGYYTIDYRVRLVTPGAANLGNVAVNITNNTTSSQYTAYQNFVNLPAVVVSGSVTFSLAQGQEVELWSFNSVTGSTIILERASLIISFSPFNL